jgi:hypothetical protein
MNKLTLTKKDFTPRKGFNAEMKDLEQKARDSACTATWCIEDDTLIIEITSAEPLDELAAGLQANNPSGYEIYLEKRDALRRFIGSRRRTERNRRRTLLKRQTNDSQD